MGKNKAKPPEPAKPMTARECIAQQTGTSPDDWHPTTKSSAAYRKGFRWVNLNTRQYAKRTA